MEIGDIKEIDGVKRKVIGFSVINGTSYPNTEPYKEETEEEQEKEEQEEPKEPEKETDSEFKCRYCGKVCKNALGLASHEKACKENPENKEVEDGNN